MFECSCLSFLNVERKGRKKHVPLIGHVFGMTRPWFQPPISRTQSTTFNHDYHGVNHNYHGVNHDYHGVNHDYHGVNHDYHGVWLQRSLLIKKQITLGVPASFCPCLRPSVPASVLLSLPMFVCPSVRPCLRPSIPASVLPCLCPSIRPSLPVFVCPPIHPCLRE